jgi:hypothetical protein
MGRLEGHRPTGTTSPSRSIAPQEAHVRFLRPVYVWHVASDSTRRALNSATARRRIGRGRPGLPNARVLASGSSGWMSCSRSAERRQLDQFATGHGVVRSRGAAVDQPQARLTRPMTNSNTKLATASLCSPPGSRVGGLSEGPLERDLRSDVFTAGRQAVYALHEVMEVRRV